MLHLRQHSDIAAIQIVDPLEEAPPVAARYGVTAGGTPGILDTRSTLARRAYEDYFSRHHQSVAAIMRGRAIPLLRLSTGDDVADRVAKTFCRECHALTYQQTRGMNPNPQQVLQLRDIHLPGEPAFWPPAPGWWLVAAVLVIVLVWTIIVAMRRYRIHRQRQRVLAALAGLEHELATDRTPYALARMSVLLRRLALMRFPRQQVAALTGNAWLRFLDESGGNGRFADGPGRVLASGPYQRSLPSDLDATGLVALVREWVGKNTGSADVNIEFAWPWMLAALPLPLLAPVAACRDRGGSASTALPVFQRAARDAWNQSKPTLSRAPWHCRAGLAAAGRGGGASAERG